MLEIIKRFFEGFDYLTGKLLKLNFLKKISLLIFTVTVYPLSLFVLLCLYFISIFAIIIFKSFNWIKR